MSCFQASDSNSSAVATAISSNSLGVGNTVGAAGYGAFSGIRSKTQAASSSSGLGTTSASKGAGSLISTSSSSSSQSSCFHAISSWSHCVSITLSGSTGYGASQTQATSPSAGLGTTRAPNGCSDELKGSRKVRSIAARNSFQFWVDVVLKLWINGSH
ncbi:hypothetical protein BJ741DRAFT_611523 [Chytriomyces cf. hyalinus JEL632]|nr:hypothetical protein BJ741DRAFT_611523 [Chytriomyces cf. hyalinus JEL632]